MARDVGNANPRFIRATTSAIPNQSDLLQTSGMPLAVFVNPLATLKNDEVQVPIVDNGGMGPVRCLRCKAYVNPGMRWVDHFRFACNFCAHVSECPREYACALGSDGKRQDWMQRPELCRGSVEYMAPEEYMVRAPMRPSYFFVIDVSPSAVQSGVTVSACEVISRTLDNIQGGDAASVGVATFDGTVHFYAIRDDQVVVNGTIDNQENEKPTSEASKTPRMLIVPDVDDPYAPLPKDLLVNLNKNKDAIKNLLKQIPEMFANSRPSAVVSGAAIKSAIDALKYKGGKIMLFLGSMCSGGWGKLEIRTHTGNVEKEPLKIMKPADKCYQDCATEAAEYQIGIDVFVCGSQPVDVATLGVLTRTTGGTLYRYANFNVQLDFAQLLNDVRWNFLRPQGMEAVMRVRASQGLGVAEYSGYFCKRTPTDVDLPVLDGEKSIMVNLRYEDKLADGSEAYVQCALLYTTMTGERRIRVHTLALPVTAVLGTLFRNADLDAQMCFMVRKAAGTLLGGKHTIAAAKDAALAQCVASLYAYRKFCASNNASGQLILPEALKTLPLYTIGMYKSNGLRAEAAADDRAYWLLKMLKSDPCDTTPSVYPRLFPLHLILESGLNSSAANDDTTTTITKSDGVYPPFPPCQWLSAEKLDADGLYLLEDGCEILIWVGRNYPQERLKDIFGCDTIDQLDARTSMLPSNLPNERNKRMNLFINAMRKARSGYLRMRILKRNDPMETIFYNRLIEDRSVHGMSYVEFLCHVHRLIQNKFS
jgi:protein transport protein SEC24